MHFLHLVLSVVSQIATPNEKELLEELTSYKEKLAPFITNTTNMVWKALDEGKKILLEGAQGTMLDIDHICCVCNKWC